MTCARSLPSCRGAVAIYVQPDRNRPQEQHRLCDQCVADLSGAPLRLRFVRADVRIIYGRWREQDRLAAPA